MNCYYKYNYFLIAGGEITKNKSQVLQSYNDSQKLKTVRLTHGR